MMNDLDSKAASQGHDSGCIEPLSDEMMRCNELCDECRVGHGHADDTML